MIQIQNIECWSDLAVMLAWTLAVMGLTRALFRSMPAELLTRSLNLLYREPLMQMAMLERVIQTGRIMGRDPSDLKKPQDQSASRGDVLVAMGSMKQLASQTRVVRIALYLLGCPFCQSAWSALILLLCVDGLRCGVGAMLLNMVAYAAAAVTVEQAASTRK